jgi:hypothetical protein
VLDEAAAGRLGDPSVAVPTDDLRAAGWVVEAPARADDGSVTLRAEREFSGADQLPLVLDEVGGAGGVFRDVRLTVSDGFGEVTYDFGARVQLSGSPEQFGDAFLTGSLEGLALGRTPEELAADGAGDPDAMSLRVRVALPGGVPETDGQLVDGAASWTFPVTGGTPTDAVLRTTSSTAATRLTVLVGLGVLAIVASVVLAAVGLVRRRGGPGSRPAVTAAP